MQSLYIRNRYRVICFAISMSQASAAETSDSSARPEFAFLTNHGKTLLLIAQDPRIRMRDIAGLLNITERATQRIVADLEKAGYLEREREGRRNVYTVRTYLPLGLPIQRDTDIRSLLTILPAASGAQ
jgi:DNA-binding MarR family transcriptional regulator